MLFIIKKNNVRTTRKAPRNNPSRVIYSWLSMIRWVIPAEQQHDYRNLPLGPVEADSRLHSTAVPDREHHAPAVVDSRLLALLAAEIQLRRPVEARSRPAVRRRVDTERSPAAVGGRTVNSRPAAAVACCFSPGSGTWWYPVRLGVNGWVNTIVVCR